MTETSPSNIPTFDGEEVLAGIRRWVEIETPSHDGAAVNRLVDVVESDLTRIGARTMRTPGRDGYGADGRGAQALDEQISFSSLVPRVQLLVRMLETLR